MNKHFFNTGPSCRTANIDYYTFSIRCLCTDVSRNAVEMIVYFTNDLETERLFVFLTIDFEAHKQLPRFLSEVAGTRVSSRKLLVRTGSFTS